MSTVYSHKFVFKSPSRRHTRYIIESMQLQLFLYSQKKKYGDRNNDSQKKISKLKITKN